MNRQSPVDATHWQCAKPWLVVAMAGVMSACGGGGSDNASSGDMGSQPTGRNGELMVAITDAEGDFLAYEVDIAAIKLQKANGTEIETIPLSMRVDFAEYTDLTEFFTIKTLPQGVYTQVSLSLNFATADIQVEDASGNAQAASAVDNEGNALTTLDVAVQLPNDRPMVIRPGVPAGLTVDFDLAASNTLLSFDPAVVEVSPLLVVSAGLDSDREHRARGTLESVDLDSGEITLTLQPFRSDRATLGSVTVQTSDDTHYDIDGTGYTGAEGLAILAAAESGLPLLLWGQVSAEEGMTVSRVAAGDSIPWVGRTGVRGIVVAREGNTLTLRGGHAERGNGRAEFHEDLTVLVSETTQISAAAVDGELALTDISVGQRLVATGELSEDEAGNPVLDASEGFVRLQINLVQGEVLSLVPLVLDVATINGRDVAHFDFTGTQADGASDPDAYRVTADGLSLSGVELSEWVRVRGYPSAFGSGDQDFVATTVVDVNSSQRDSAVGIVWPGTGATAPIVSSSESALVLDVNDARTVFKRGTINEDGVEAPTNLTIQPQPEAANLVFTVRTPGQGPLQSYDSFADFAAAINEQLNLGYALKRFGATGQYDADTGVMSSLSASAQFHPTNRDR